MKDWLTIGQFAKKIGVSPRTLRVYEQEGLITSQARGENGYRYFGTQQLDLMKRIMKFKELGFSLSEIRSLLMADQQMDSQRLKEFMSLRLLDILQQQFDLERQKRQIESILSSLDQPQVALDQSKRRYIMSHFEKVSIVVTGTKDLELTARLIVDHLKHSEQKIPILQWRVGMDLPTSRPHVLIIHEKDLATAQLSEFSPDIVVIKDLSEFTPATEAQYLKLYRAVGPHMATIFNADDRISVNLAANEIIRQGKTYYFSKNKGLEDQIQKIGGIVSDGEEAKIFGFNRRQGVLRIKIEKAVNFDSEVALLASLAAVMDIGLNQESIRRIF